MLYNTIDLNAWSLKKTNIKRGCNMNFNEKQRELRFETKEQAKYFKGVLIKHCNINHKISMRKSLPDFKGHLQRKYSVYFTAFSFAEYCKIAELYKGLI